MITTSPKRSFETLGGFQSPHKLDSLGPRGQMGGRWIIAVGLLVLLGLDYGLLAELQNERRRRS